MPMQLWFRKVCMRAWTPLSETYTWFVQSIACLLARLPSSYRNFHCLAIAENQHALSSHGLVHLVALVWALQWGWAKTCCSELSCPCPFKLGKAQTKKSLNTLLYFCYIFDFVMFLVCFWMFFGLTQGSLAGGHLGGHFGFTSPRVFSEYSPAGLPRVLQVFFSAPIF